jgi:PAS domain S-box-containing protein
MACAAAQSSSTWVEDRATQRCDPSADPGAETEGRAALLPPTFTRLRDQHQSAKPSRHEAAKFPTGRSSQVANVNRHKFHFPLNQHTRSILLARKRAEEELRKRSEWLRITLASIGDAVISTDAEARVTFMNGIAESLTGWTQSEAMGRPLSEVFQIVNERTREPSANPALRALQEGTVVGLANHTILIARDGKERPIDDSAAPIRDDSGAAVGAVLVFRDVTERRAAEEAQARLATIVESSQDAIISKTLDGVIRSWNTGAQRLFDYAPHEAIGRPITLIIPPDRRDEEYEILARISRGERIEHFETVRVSKHGAPHRHLPDGFTDPRQRWPRCRRLEGRPRRYRPEAHRQGAPRGEPTQGTNSLRSWLMSFAIL